MNTQVLAAKETIKVMVVDDHTIFRQGLVALLERYRHIEVVAQAGSAIEAMEQVGKHAPDVLLMNMKMPGMHSIQAVEQIKKEFPLVKVVILTMYGDADYVLRALKAGASGYVPKSASVDRLIEVIENTQNGQKPHFNLAVDSDVLLRVNEIGFMSKGRGLRERERSILRLLADGYSNKQIAESLFLSAQTVKGYVHSILRKLDAFDRTQAAVIALREGLLD